jgi:hypothetical protein
MTPPGNASFVYTFNNDRKSSDAQLGGAAVGVIACYAYDAIGEDTKQRSDFQVELVCTRHDNTGKGEETDGSGSDDLEDAVSSSWPGMLLGLGIAVFAVWMRM